jgi:hypothetical protein
MVPGAGEYGVLVYQATGGATKQQLPREGAAARVAFLLLTTNLRWLTVTDLEKRCGMRAGHYAHTIATATVRKAMATRNWRETTRKAAGLPGKGKLLMRGT